jgi:hypothetical protein
VFGLFGIAAALPAWRVVRSGVTGRDLIAVLGLTGRAQMVFGFTFAVGLLIGA